MYGGVSDNPPKRTGDEEQFLELGVLEKKFCSVFVATDMLFRECHFKA
jgi:hypothetical protein